MPPFLRLLPYPVLALTVVEGEQVHASLVSWATQVSFEPRLVAVALERDARTLHAVRAASRFALALLPDTARRTASRIGRASSEVADKLAGVPFDGVTPAGVPLLAESREWVECERRAEHPVGDHVLVVAEVVATGGERTEGDDASPILTLLATGWRYAG